MKRLLWTGIAIVVAAVVAVPAWIALGGDDDGARRAGALSGGAIVGTDVAQLTVGNVNGGLPFNIRSYRWGVISPRDLATGQATGQVRHEVLEVTRPIDPLTPPLFDMLVKSTNAPTATLELLSTAVEGGKPQVYMTYQFTNARLSSWINESSETVALFYQTVVMKPGTGGLPARPATEVVGQMSVAGGAPVPIVGIKSEVIAPFDAATGLASGKRQHKPFVVRRAIDDRSEALLGSITSNALLTEVKIELVQPGAATPYATYTLRNATIASYHHSGAGGSAPIEEVAFTYQAIDVMSGKAMATDSWAATTS